jgi:hypothetical protein
VNKRQLSLCWTTTGFDLGTPYYPMSRADKKLYVKQFSSLGYGAPIYEPCDVQLGDVGFINAQDGYFQKLYNVADSDLPKYGVAGCPVSLKLVKSKPQAVQWDGIHVCTTHPLSLSFSDSTLTA